MNRGTGLIPAVLALALGAFVLWSMHLVLGQYATGTSTPGSSLSTAPTGASAYFNSLPRLGLDVIHNQQPHGLDALAPSTNTLFVLEPALLPEARLDTYLDFVQRGGRLVLSGPLMFAPRAHGRAGPITSPVTNRWRQLGLLVVDLPHRTPETGAGAGPELAAATAIPFRPSMVFRPHQPAWTAVVTSPAGALVITRTWGHGRLILLSDTYPLTNQALRRAADSPVAADGASELLFARWLAGERSTVVVDDTVHGVSAQLGPLWLIQRYRLMPALAALLVLFGLFLWYRLGMIAAPENDLGGSSDQPPSRLLTDLRLLQRALPPERLIARCLHELGREAPGPLPQDPVAAFNHLAPSRFQGERHV